MFLLLMKSQWREGVRKDADAYVLVVPGCEGGLNKSKGHSGGVSARVAFETNCRIDPVPFVAALTNKDTSWFLDQAA